MSSIPSLLLNLPYIIHLSRILHLSYICACTVFDTTVAPVCGLALVGVTGSKPPRAMDMRLVRLLCVVQVEVSAAGRSLVQRIPVECGVP